VLSLVGNAKNAGKTTVLGALLTAHPHLRPGITSIGLDGEDLDTVSFLPKPQITLSPGALVATAEGCLKQSDFAWQMLERTGIMTGLGEIVIVQAQTAGACLVGGPSSVKAMEQVGDSLLRLGADKVFIDGAFARSSHAAAGEALIYVAGAHQGPDMRRVADNADYALRRFSLAAVDESLRFLAQEQRPGWVDNQGAFHPIDAASALGQAQQVLDQVPPDAPWLYLPGAAGPEFVRRFVQQRDRHRCGLILVDGLSIVAGDDALRHLFLMERPLCVLRPLHVAFVAANPYSPSGRRFDNAAFLAALRAVTDLNVINVLEDDAIAPNE